MRSDIDHARLRQSRPSSHVLAFSQDGKRWRRMVSQQPKSNGIEKGRPLVPATRVTANSQSEDEAVARLVVVVTPAWTVHQVSTALLEIRARQVGRVALGVKLDPMLTTSSPTASTPSHSGDQVHQDLRLTELCPMIVKIHLLSMQHESRSLWSRLPDLDHRMKCPNSQPFYHHPCSSKESPVLQASVQAMPRSGRIRARTNTDDSVCPTLLRVAHPACPSWAGSRQPSPSQNPTRRPRKARRKFAMLSYLSLRERKRSQRLN
jgi:hypothetical protein